MELKNILESLNDEQIKELSKALDSNPNKVIKLLQTRIDEKDAEEKRKTELANLKKNFSSFKKVKDQIKQLFTEVTSNNESKDLVSKLHDRITAIVIEYIILEMERFEYEKINYVNYGYDMWVINGIILRMSKLEEQYELLSYIYGELIGLSDEEIINKGKSLEYYGAVELFNDVKHNGRSIIENINDFYLNYHNGKRYYCVRNKNNQLSYPDIDKESPRNGMDFYSLRKSVPRDLEKYFPFAEIEYELIHEIIKPYYEKIGTGISIYGPYEITIDVDIEDREKFQKTISFTNDYQHVEQFGRYVDREILFDNQYEYNITKQLVNEYLSQKERNKQL